MQYVTCMFQVLAALLMMNGLVCGQPVRIIEQDIPYAAPFFADVDGDGARDLVVGQYQDDPYTGARVRLFRNIGTAKVPKFDEGTFLQAGDADASCDEFCYTGFGPQLIDFNGDGLRDLITGSRDSNLFVFPGQNSGRFETAIRMTYVPDQHSPVNFRYNSRLFAHDWDCDGDLDLLVARYTAVWLIRNEGNAKSPQFATPVELVHKGADGLSFKVPVAADWNHDGRVDLILGRSDGSVAWLENTAVAGAEPVLSDPVVLVGPGVSNDVTADDNGHYERPQAPTIDIRLCVADYNDDGQLDLLLGDAWILRSYKSGMSDEEKQRQIEAYAIYRKSRDQLLALQKVPENETNDARTFREARITTQKAECGKSWRAAHADGGQFSRHGSVWLIQR